MLEIENMSVAVLEVETIREAVLEIKAFGEASVSIEPRQTSETAILDTETDLQYGK